jgi:hypothetical protein
MCKIHNLKLYVAMDPIQSDKSNLDKMIICWPCESKKPTLLQGNLNHVNHKPNIIAGKAGQNQVANVFGGQNCCKLVLSHPNTSLYSLVIVNWSYTKLSELRLYSKSREDLLKAVSLVKPWSKSWTRLHWVWMVVNADK